MNTEYGDIDFALRMAKQLQTTDGSRVEVPKNYQSGIIPLSLTQGTRGYVEKVVYQINKTYTLACYDACLVMCRRLVETLVIEACEMYDLKPSIINKDGNYLMLGELIDVFLTASNNPMVKWKVGRECSKALPKLKNLGDRSAHDRRFNAHKHNIDDISEQLIVVIQELTVMLRWK